jgi:hypothetical protein
VGPAGRNGQDIPPPWWKSHGPFTFKANDKWEAIADTHSMLHTKRNAATLLPYMDPGALAALYVRNMDTTQWQAVCVVQGGSPPPVGSIRVISATYGANCGAPADNATAHIADQCDGEETCKYRVYYGDIGDPAHGCAKAYSVQYRCGGGSVRQESLDPEAGLGDKSVLLDCSGG